MVRTYGSTTLHGTIFLTLFKSIVYVDRITHQCPAVYTPPSQTSVHRSVSHAHIDPSSFISVIMYDDPSFIALLTRPVTALSGFWHPTGIGMHVRNCNWMCNFTVTPKMKFMICFHSARDYEGHLKICLMMIIIIIIWFGDTVTVSHPTKWNTNSKVRALSWVRYTNRFVLSVLQTYLSQKRKTSNQQAKHSNCSCQPPQKISNPNQSDDVWPRYSR